MTYTYNRKGITRKVLSEIVRGLGAKDELKILKFHNLDADAISEVYISDSAPASTER